MNAASHTYRAVLSSDWNECLAPCGPFDCISYIHPGLTERLTEIFRSYTSNTISLSEAVGRLRQDLPRLLSPEEMDAYLDAAFATYPGLSDWMEWCLSRGILFMLNTTGMMGTLQRIFAKGLLPRIHALSAHPLIRYDPLASDPETMLELFEIHDKPRNTQAVLRTLGLAQPKVIVMGDSGGDGPHFEWGAKVGALIIGSMTKPSLEAYCRDRGVQIHVRFGGVGSGETTGEGIRTPGENLMELVPVIEEFLER